MFSQYLLKNYNQLKPWIESEKVQAYRLYDKELVNFPVSIDVYNKYFHVYIFENLNISTSKVISEINHSIQDVFPDVSSEDIFYKIKKRQKSGSQYEKVGNKNKRISIMENNVKFNINLTDYLDTGIFLDHRSTRKIFSSLVKNKKRVLNLFAYTGAFSLVAAKNGVEFTTSVDMSNTYCDWAKENIKLNGLDEYKHIVIRENVFFFLENIKNKNWKFDFIVIDPPTVSRSKKMLNKFDIQRDYPFLINTSARYLNDGGKILFSTNFRKFKFNSELIHLKKIIDITESTIPPDFKDPYIHRVYLLSNI